jgi:uncharacterized protein (DUF1330 family)
MTILRAGFALVSAAAALAIALSAIVGLRQPSRRIHRHGRIIFAALRQGDPCSPLGVPPSLWASRALFTFVGDGDPYWTDCLIYPVGSIDPAELTSQPAILDAFLAEVDLSRVPLLIPGGLRLRHLLGLSRRPSGQQPVIPATLAGRRELLPTPAAIARAEAEAKTPVAMINFLEYAASARDGAQGGRAAYRRYARQAFRAVHAVGGQFLFAGTITAVLAWPRSPAWQVVWDDLAAMIYPDPSAILAMEQFAFYRRALAAREAGLKSTRVIATRAY